MATYTVQAPDGKTITLDGPDGASQADVIAQAQALYAAHPASAAPPAAPSGVNPAAFAAAQSAAAKNDAQDPYGARGEDQNRALANSYSFGGAFPVKGGIEATKTAVLNLLGRGPGYSAGDAYKATVAEEQQRLDAYKAAHPTESGAYSFAGAAGNPLNVVGGEWINGATGAAKVARAALAGGAAGTGFGAADAKPGQRVQGAVTGGLTGAGAGGVLEVGGQGLAVAAKAAAAKAAANPSAQQILAKAGVLLTPGQAMGGIPKRVEDLATSLPIAGASINAARTRGIQSLNTAVANRVLEPLGVSVPKGVAPGQDAVSFAKTAIGNAYNDAARAAPLVNIDPTFMGEMGVIKGNAGLMSTPDQQQFNAIVSNIVTPRLSGPVDGVTIRQIQRELGALNAKLPPAQNLLKDNISDLNSALMSQLGRASPEAADLVGKANASYARFVTLRGAAAKDVADGVATPGQFGAAMKANDRSAGKGSTATGNAQMQDLISAAMKVLPSKIPDSGTAGRLMAGGGLYGGGGAMFPHLTAPVLATDAVIGAANTEPVQRATTAAVANLSPGQLRALIAAAMQRAAQSPALTARVPGLLGAPQSGN